MKFKLEYYNGIKWEFVSEWDNWLVAWISLGTDNYNYRIVDTEGNIIKSNREIPNYLKSKQ